mmetsp:Transcript_15740/g.26270  ORF Transcript_15740/g.26270 Transcript_15740/m.26270 type:complete len:878 (+) Transcript_15740:104-2737(+)
MSLPISSRCLSIIFLVWTAVLATASASCSLYLAPSLVKGGGKAVFVGTQVKVGKAIGQSEGLLIDDYLVQDLQLMDYAFESHYDLYSAVFFGPALMLNHAPEKEATIVKKWNRGVVPPPETVALRPFSNYLGVSFQARSKLKPGTEVTFMYGNEAYFAERNMHFNFRDDDYTATKPLSYSLDELDKVGHCLSDIYVNKSSIPMGGKGVFSAKTFEEGSTVSVSPVLVVPKHVLEKAGRSSVLFNYCFSDKGTDLAILPLGTAAMINHDSNPNVGVRWYYWDGDEKKSAHDILSGNLTQLLRAPAAPLYLEYYATRLINDGEELKINYGSAWDDAWSQYVTDMTHWTEVYGDKANLLAAPQFRQPITIPRGMFPESAYDVPCFGTRDCEAYFEIRQPKHFHRQLNSDVAGAHRFDYDSVMTARRSSQEAKDCAADAGPSEAPEGSDESSRCFLYLAPTYEGPGGGGRSSMGIFSGVAYERGDVLDVSPAVLVSTQMMESFRHVGAPTMRNHYMTVLFGPGAAARPFVLSNIDRTYDAKDRLRSIPSPQAQALRPYNIYTKMLYYASEPIAKGEELTIYSGEPLTDDIEEQVKKRNAIKYSLSELKKKGHCLTNIYVNRSTIPLAGNGVFSRRSHEVGSVVSISPSAVVARHALEEEASSVLINSCLSDDNTDVCVLPLGLASFMNHHDKPNVALRWHVQKNLGSSRTAENMLTDHLNALMHGGMPLYVEYYAIRPIASEDELTIWYGDEWIAAQDQYLSVLSSWLQEREGDIENDSINVSKFDMMSAPQFRRHISMPPGMFPPSVFERPPCLGDQGCSGPRKLQRPFKIEQSLNRDVHSRSIFKNDEKKVKSEDEKPVSHSESPWRKLWRSINDIFAM